MRLKKIFKILVPACLLALCVTSCDKGNGGNNNGNTGGNGGGNVTNNDTLLQEWTRPTMTSDSLYVKKVNNLDDDFVLGMDASCVPSLEKSGVKYYDAEGKEKDVYEILSNHGINNIRVRVWNDPYDENGKGYGGGNCDINNAIEIGKRANKYGMKLTIDFHYSDFWADPAKQMVPKAWKNLKIFDDSMPEALYNFTKESLQKLKDEKIAVGMVQVGNETNQYLCGSKDWPNIAKLMRYGSKAVREVYPDALVALHFANPEKITNYRTYAKQLDYYQVDYDVFGSSYYPYCHGTLDNLSSLLSEIATTYKKKTMVLETSYAFTSVDTDFSGNTISDGGAFVKNYPFTMQGQANSVRNIVDTIKNKTTNGCGVFYWEGTWISVGTTSWEENSAKWEQYGSGWASSFAGSYDSKDAGQYYGGCAVDNQAFFDSKGKVIESLKVFSLMKNGNEIPLKVDGTEEKTLIHAFTDTIDLPTKVNAVMTDNSKQEVNVTWNKLSVVNEDTTVTKIMDIASAADYSTVIEYLKTHGVNKYQLEGKADNLTCYCYVSMVDYNYLTNYSFEDDANLTKVPTGWTVNAIKASNELWVEDKATDSITGTKHFHFWASGTNNVEFTLEQKITNLPQGKYKYQISIMGGDAGDTEIYAYVKINGEIVKTAPGQITIYNEWHKMLINDIDYNGTDEIVVGIYVKCGGSGNGAWGKIDDALFNAVI